MKYLDENTILQREIKNYLGITWDDNGTDKKVDETISQGKHKVMKLTNSPNSDFFIESDARRMLFEYCRLAWAGVPEKFDEVYKSDIVGARLDKILEAWE